ncbi:MAG: DUF1622 domain-containing protein [Syntrophorhabdaceae bacterium]|nr:DUF1622 domain-containing protein [Syntrophorhabdaceae bacterium]
MESEVVKQSIEVVALGIEVFAVAIIVGGAVHGLVRYPFHQAKKIEAAYSLLKEQIGKALLLGLEFLIAADIIRTVAIDPTFRSVSELGLLVVIRTFLSWSIVVEIQGHWPWKADVRKNSKE